MGGLVDERQLETHRDGLSRRWLPFSRLWPVNIEGRLPLCQMPM